MADQKDKSLKKVSGGTIIDYVAWRGDLTFEHSPWGEIDGVIATMIAYANLGENELVFGSGSVLAHTALTFLRIFTIGFFHSLFQHVADCGRRTVVSA